MKKKVLLSAGHGEGDPGAVSKWGKEADLARELLMRILPFIDQIVLDPEVYDMEKDCYQQTKKGKGPDYGDQDFILEIHFNAKHKKDEDGDGVFTGTGGYIHSGADPIVAEAMIDKIGSLGFQKWCLCETDELCNCNAAWNAGTPYFLLETVFLDDGDDMQFYNRKKEEVAKSIADVLNEKVGEKQSVSDPKEEKKMYRVQCGAFLKRTNAEVLKKQLEQAGFSAIIVEK